MVHVWYGNVTRWDSFLAAVTCFPLYSCDIVQSAYFAMAHRRGSTLTQPTDVNECVLDIDQGKRMLMLYLDFSDDLRKEREELALPFSKSPFIDGEKAATEATEVHTKFMK